MIHLVTIAAFAMVVSDPVGDYTSQRDLNTAIHGLPAWQRHQIGDAVNADREERERQLMQQMMMNELTAPFPGEER